MVLCPHLLLTAIISFIPEMHREASLDPKFGGSKFCLIIEDKFFCQEEK